LPLPVSYLVIRTVEDGFDEEEIELLNRVVGTATYTQRAWLAGFLSGLEASTTLAQPSAPPTRAEPLTIIYATESGNSEKLAGDLAKAARKNGLRPNVVDMADLDVVSLASARRLVVVAAIWGEGEPPARAARAYNELIGEGAPRLDGVEFGVLALGDSAYAEFCATGRKIDQRLAALGGKRVVERVDCDLDFATAASRWIEQVVKTLAPADAEQANVITVDFGAKPAAVDEAEPVEVEITEHINLNSSRSAKETIHVELAFDGAAPGYKPGDSLDIWPENDPEYVEALLKSVGLLSDDALRAEFIKDRDVTTLSLKTLEAYGAATGDARVKTLIESGEGKSWVAGRQLIDLIDRFPTALSAEQLRALTRPLAPRAYSIASSRREVGEEAHLLISAVRYETHGRARKGVASTFVAERLGKGGRLRVKLKPNKHFALPAPDRDIIMIGPGTGIAPFRAFVQERRAIGASGRSWLFFGDRNFRYDFLYQLEWQEALADRSLTRMGLGLLAGPAGEGLRAPPFVGTAPRRDRLARRRRVPLCLWRCQIDGQGRARSAAARYADVKALAPEAAERAVAELERNKRYMQDVY
jgi:sulfite reductase (NADPH) flavoprotein alpha-component